jgi:hypothetical protein
LAAWPSEVGHLRRGTSEGAPQKPGNGDGDVYARKNKEGKVIGYRGTYWVHTASVPKRRYVSGKSKAVTREALNKASADRDGGLVYGADGLKVEDYLRRWLKDSVRGTVRATTF